MSIKIGPFPVVFNSWGLATALSYHVGFAVGGWIASLLGMGWNVIAPFEILGFTVLFWTLITSAKTGTWTSGKLIRELDNTAIIIAIGAIDLLCGVSMYFWFSEQHVCFSVVLVLQCLTTTALMSLLYEPTT